MKRISVISLLLLAISSSAFGEKITINFDITLDKVGNANIVYTQKATALQWKNLVQVYGNNPSLLKREIIFSLPSYDLCNFSFKRDDMNRIMKFSFDAKGVVKYKGKGKWEFEYDKKSTVKKISDIKWFFTNTETEENVLYEYDVSLSLPEDATDAKLTQNEFGKNVLQYHLKAGPGMSIWVLLGLILLLGGVVTIIAVFVFIKE